MRIMAELVPALAALCAFNSIFSSRRNSFRSVVEYKAPPTVLARSGRGRPHQRN
jgi:hypothetical protein